MKKSVFAAAVAACALSLSAENNLVVTEPTTLTTAGKHYYDGATFRADYTIDNNSEVTSLRLTNAASRVDFGPESGDHPVITIRNKKAHFFSYTGTSSDPDTLNASTGPTAVIGANGGSATFVVTNAAGMGLTAWCALSTDNSGLYLRNLTVSENARTAADSLDVLRIQKNGTAAIRKLYNKNTTKPVRILFEGGLFQMAYYGGSATPFSTDAGAVTILEGVDGNDVQLVKSYAAFKLAEGEGPLVITGNCNCVMKSYGETWTGQGSNPNKFAWTLGNYNLVWAHTGDLILDRSCWLKLDADNKLPVGPKTGNVIVNGPGQDGANWCYGVLDLNGHTAAVNGLITEGYGVVSNVTPGITTSKIRLGTCDDDGVLRAACGPDITVEKVGTGVLRVSDTTADTLQIKEGSVVFGANNAFKNPIEFGEGTTVSLADMTDDQLKTPTGVIPGAYTGSPDSRYIKVGDETEYLRGGAHFDGKTLEIRAGTAQFTGGTTDKWWRFTVEQGINGDSGNIATSAELNALTLWSTNVAAKGANRSKFLTSGAYGANRPVSVGMVTNSAAFMEGQVWDGTDYSALPAGTCMRPANEQVTPWDLDGSGRDYTGTPEPLFGGLTATGSRYGDAVCYETKGPKGKIKVDDPDSWAQIVWRLPADVPEAAGYGMCRTAWSYAPYRWKVESSADGRTWTLRDEHQAYWNPAATNVAVAPTVDIACSLGDFPAVPSSLKNTAGCGLWYNQGKPYRFTQGATAAERVKDVKVSVAQGATLDTDYLLDEAFSVAELTVDFTAGAGTITKFSPAANGVLRLTNVGSAAAVRKYEVPIVLGSLVNAANLASWTVVVDGKTVDAKVLFEDGKLYVKNIVGLLLLVR